MLNYGVIKLDSVHKDKSEEERNEIILDFIRNKGGTVETTRMMREGDITARASWKLTVINKLKLFHDGETDKWFYTLVEN